MSDKPMPAKKCQNCSKSTLTPQTSPGTERKLYCSNCGATVKLPYELLLSSDLTVRAAGLTSLLARVQELAPRVGGIERHLEDGQKISSAEQTFYDAVKEFSAGLVGVALEEEIDKLFKLTEDI